jgi:capsular polysaccharide biosynthesis protein
MTRWIVAAVIVVLGAAGGFAYTLIASPTYEATATVIATETEPAGSRRDVAVALALSRLTNQQESLTAAATQVGLGVEEVKRSVRGSVTPESPVIAITAEAGTGAQAAQIANAVANALVTFGTGKAAATGVTLSVLNVAGEPTEPSSPQLLLDLAVGVGAGVLVAALYLMATGGLRPRAAPAPSGSPPNPVRPVQARPAPGPSARPFPPHNSPGQRRYAAGPPQGPSPDNRPPHGRPPRAPR